MKVLNDLFDYSLKIYQNSDYFKFSIDSILLGEFVKDKKIDKLLDLCTGNAPIPLILSTKNFVSHIDAIEIQKPIYDLAVESVKINKLEKYITIINEDVKKYEAEGSYDAVTCNPPYFKTNSSVKNSNKIKLIARHEELISLEEVISCAKKFLKENGTFYLVQRIDRFLETISLLENQKFGIRRVVFIYTKKGSKAEFFLIEASKYKKSDLKVYNICTENLKTYKDLFKEGYE